jgi:hypothetical protein
MNIVTFYELATTPTVEESPDGKWARTGPRTLMVKHDSAVLGVPYEVAILCDGNHSELAKLKRGQAGDYTSILAHMRKALQRLRPAQGRLTSSISQMSMQTQTPPQWRPPEYQNSNSSVKNDLMQESPEDEFFLSEETTRDNERSEDGISSLREAPRTPTGLDDISSLMEAPRTPTGLDGITFLGKRPEFDTLHLRHRSSRTRSLHFKEVENSNEGHQEGFHHINYRNNLELRLTLERRPLRMIEVNSNEGHQEGFHHINYRNHLELRLTLERRRLRMILAFLNIMWLIESDLVNRRRSLTK